MNRTVSPLQQTSLYKMCLYPLNSILKFAWIHPPTPQEYEVGTMELLKNVHQHQPRKLLVDCSKRGNSTPQDMLWLTHQVMPLLHDEAIEQLALVVPQDPHHARDLESCLMSLEVSYDLQFFHDPTDALHWLRHTTGNFKGRSVA